MCACVETREKLPDSDRSFNRRSFLWRHCVAWLEILEAEKKININFPFLSFPFRRYSLDQKDEYIMFSYGSGRCL